jgi:cytochrome P450 family 135
MPDRPPGSRLPAAAQTALMLLDPVGGFERAQRRYGPMFQVRLLGFPPEVLVTTAELAEPIYALDAGGGRAGEVRREFLEPAVGRNSLLTLDGEPWWRHRRLLSPPLHGKAIERYRDEIAEITAAAIATWPLDRPFALRDRMQEITLEVILRLVFGIRDTRRLTELRTLLPRLVDVSGATLSVMMMPSELRTRLERAAWLRRLRFLPSTRFFAVRDEVDRLLYDEIARRRASGGSGATDVLSRLLAARDDAGRPLGDEELRDELVTMLEAGHETTATALAWTFERLLREPAVLSRLRAELDAAPEGDDASGAGARADEGAGGTYLDAVVKESLRARPVVYDAPRLLDAPLTLGGYDIPAGWYVGPLISLIHRDPKPFPRPDEFRPERFLAEDGNDPRLAAKAWMPFGGGRRYCAGAQLALLEMRVIIAEVLRRLDLRAPDPAPERQSMKHVTLVPARRTRVVARARRRTPAGS